MKIRRFEDGRNWVELREDNMYRSTWFPNWIVSHVGPENFMWGDWKEILNSTYDPNDLFPMSTAKPCCGGGIGNVPATYSQGRWHDTDCDTLKPPPTIQTQSPKVESLDYRVKGKKCTCGSAACGSDRHSSWCDSI